MRLGDLWDRHLRKVLKELLRQIELALVQSQDLLDLIEALVHFVQLRLGDLRKAITTRV